VTALTDRTPSPVAARVRALADEALAGTDLFVVDVVVRGAEGHRVVEVFVDGPAGAGIDAIAEASRRLSFLLDAEDVVPGRYRLDVSSPGTDRPLTDPRQYGRHVGRTLRVSYMAEANDPGEEVTLTGVLRAAGPGGLTLEVPGRADAVDVPFPAIRDARVVLPW
jgi:ribosome maturation factor RimP